MCEKCIEEGKMTREQLNLHMEESKDLTDEIMDLCEGKFEEVVINSLLSCMINVSNDLNIPSIAIISALILGFGGSKPIPLNMENK